MSLSRVRSDLMRALRSAAASVAFEGALDRHESLRAYPTITSVLVEMQNQSPELYPQRDLLTRVFVAEAQSTKQDAWISALLAAYLPMLIRLRGRLVCDTIARPDLDQIVLEAFMQVVASFPLEKRRDRTAMRLRQETQRAVFKILARDRKEHVELRLFVDEVRRAPDLDLMSSGEPEEVSDEERAELKSALRRELCESGDGGLFDLVCRTTIGGERLVDYVRRHQPNASEAELKQLYNRLKRRRERALTRVRRRIEKHRSDDELACERQAA